MNGSNIKVSIIIPVFNAADYLAQCLGSAAGQTLKEIEILCVDDASTDGSLEIIKEFAKTDPKVRVFANEKNTGAGEARNRGLKEARGEYVYFMDADDYMVPDACEVLYAKAAEKGLDLLKAKAYSVDAVTQEEVLSPRYDLLNLKPKDFNVITNFHKDPKKFAALPVTPWSGFYRRAFLKENGIFFNSLKCVNDRSFHNEVIIKAKTVMFVDHFILYYRVNVPCSLIENRANNFECLFESYNIIKGQCAELPVKEQRCILDSALHDMFNWYRKYQSRHLSEEEINSKIREFIKSLDISVFGKELHLCRWYMDYMKLKGLRPALTYKIGRSLRNIARMALRVFQYSRNYGLKCFYRFAKVKINSRQERQVVWTQIK